jgi:hypothetical protein
VSEDRARTGRCLCGKVSYQFRPAENHIDACHCTMCRRWTGGPGLSVKVAGEPDVSGRENVAVYTSSDWAERQFCRICGTHLFYNSPAYNYFGVSAGTMDDLEGLSLTTEIFIDRKPDAYSFAGATDKLTEAEFIAMVSASTDKE